MKILGGLVKGFKLESPACADVRPALARVRTSLFNIILPRLPGAGVLDLFAGTGSLGLESLSRGAEACLLIENDRQCYEAIKKNIAKTKFDKQTTLVLLDAFQIVSYLDGQGEAGQFDVIFIAPPYAFYKDEHLKDKLFGLMDEIVDKGRLAKDGIMIVEYRLPMKWPDSKKYLVYDTREYGQTALAFLSKPQIPA
ncbi:MAG: 16S rRNA (guanine(966)-N(2))-methyltransferase RsmD [Planctomycetes bacterium]|nr:16S rRNA (guanine(966)-N(2))-methyltransferase RsmD [Planctomycetota bacterium]